MSYIVFQHPESRRLNHHETPVFRQASKHRPFEKTCPDLPKDSLGAIELTKQARKLLKEGKTELAKAKFAFAREWDANMVFGDEGL